MKKVFLNALITKLLYGKDAEFILKYVQNFSLENSVYLQRLHQENVSYRWICI